MKHKVLSTGLHCITNSKGRVYVFTEKEYQHMNWWQSVKLRYEIQTTETYKRLDKSKELT